MLMHLQRQLRDNTAWVFFIGGRGMGRVRHNMYPTEVQHDRFEHLYKQMPRHVSRHVLVNAAWVDEGAVGKRTCGATPPRHVNTRAAQQVDGDFALPMLRIFGDGVWRFCQA